MRAVRDTQRSKVYQWTAVGLRPLAGLEGLTPESDPQLAESEVRELVEGVCFDYGVPPLGLRWMNGSATATAGMIEQTREDRWSGPEIRSLGFTMRPRLAIAKAGANQLTILHELAHYLTLGAWGYGYIAQHGPEFMAAQVELLVRYGGLDERAVRESLAGFDVPKAEFVKDQDGRYLRDDDGAPVKREWTVRRSVKVADDWRNPAGWQFYDHPALAHLPVAA